MLTDELKQNTLANHQLLEKKIVSKIRKIQTPKDYLDLLDIFFSYFGGLEVLIKNHLIIDKLPDYHLRRKSEDLRNDIHFLKGNIPNLATTHQLPKITNHEEALGAMYVIEGSTLGGKIISQMISQKIGITGGISFFESYGENILPMWKAFQVILNQPQNSSHTIIYTANETFLKFSEWIAINE